MLGSTKQGFQPLFGWSGWGPNNREKVFQAEEVSSTEAWRQESMSFSRSLLINSFTKVSRTRATQRGNEQMFKSL